MSVIVCKYLVTRAAAISDADVSDAAAAAAAVVSDAASSAELTQHAVSESKPATEKANKLRTFNECVFFMFPHRFENRINRLRDPI